MKRMLALLTAATMLLVASACSDGEAAVTTSTTAATTLTTITTAATTTTETTAVTTLPSETETTTMASTTTAAKTTAKTAAKPAAKTTAKTTKKVSTIESLLNAAPLHPEKTNAPVLDAMIDDIFAKIHTAGMSTYGKVKACYDYLVNNFTYGTDPFAYFAAYGVLEDREYKSNYDAQLIINCYSILSSSMGVCDDYSAAFAVMCRRIGLEAFVRGGTITNSNGVPGGHAWATITLDGVPYIFDPQVQTRSSGSYNFFGRSYTYNSKTTYQLSDDIYNPSQFCHFAYTVATTEATAATTVETTTVPTDTATTVSTDLTAPSEES